MLRQQPDAFVPSPLQALQRYYTSVRHCAALWYSEPCFLHLVFFLNINGEPGESRGSRWGQREAEGEIPLAYSPS